MITYFYCFFQILPLQPGRCTAEAQSKAFEVLGPAFVSYRRRAGRRQMTLFIRIALIPASHLILEDVVIGNQNHNYGYSAARGTF